MMGQGAGGKGEEKKSQRNLTDFLLQEKREDEKGDGSTVWE